MIIIEMDSGSDAFWALHTATTDPGTYRLRIALDEGQFKIKINEGVWTPDRAGAEVKAKGSLPQLLRDLRLPNCAELLAEDEILLDVQKFETHPINQAVDSDRLHDRLVWKEGVTIRWATYKGWIITESKLDLGYQISNRRDAHEGGYAPSLEQAMAQIDIEHNIKIPDLVRKCEVCVCDLPAPLILTAEESFDGGLWCDLWIGDRQVVSGWSDWVQEGDFEQHSLTRHAITVDEQRGGPLESDTAYKAFCICGWSEDHWHHVDSEEDPLTAADEAGADHLEEVSNA